MAGLELLSIAAIIGYGLYSSQEGREPREDRNRYQKIQGTGEGVGETFDVQPTQMVRKYRKKAAKRWQEAQNPKISGIITPNQRPSQVMPFFTSGKTMNTNPEMSQRRMELYTGQNLAGFSESGTYKHKVEATNLFGMTPQGRVTSGGTVGNPAGDTELQKARSINAMTHNNVLPAEQLRVGPGLGVGPEVAATGGFQQFYRQLPLNVNEYKLTQLPGRLVPGSSTALAGGKGEVQQVVSVNHNPDALVLPLDERPALPTTNGAILAATQYGVEPRGYSGLRPFQSGYEGVADAKDSVPAPQGRYVDQTRGRPRTGDGQTDPVINPNGTSVAGGAVGSYVTNANQGSYTLDSQRGLINTYFVGPAGSTGVVQPSGESRPEYVPESTIREQYEAAYFTGPPGATGGQYAERMDVVQLQPESRTSKRTTQNMDYTPGAGRVNNFAPAGQGAYGLKNHPTLDALQHIIPTPGQAQTFTGEPATGENERFGTKSRVENPWGTPGSLNIASKQLANNKINRDIAKPEALEFDAANPANQQRFRPVPWSSGSVTPLWKQKKQQKQIK
ncbi:hypothetical protein ATCVCan0610SP_126L [Acanthocystis turfacea Chlorella virus Can0610SP]|nr:hypothetical protein ATCVCan0610SP_126L [Acanthocystis turfacea Chlorella virus Can0610SP]